MGKGKGRRRRQANYVAAHGGHAALPAPPSTSDVTTLPSKLRRIIQLRAPSPHGLLRSDFNESQSKSMKNLHGNKGATKKQDKIEKQELMLKADAFSQTADGGEACQNKMSAPTQKKRKREEELQDLIKKLGATPIRKGLNERKKKYLQEKKNRKRKRVHSDELNQPLHKQEKIIFGDTIDAPPKLSFPKKHPKAAEERLRREAIGMYRQKKNWSSRPGSHQPPLLASDITQIYNV